METMTVPALSLPPAAAERANTLLREHQMMIWKRTDRLLSALLECEWGMAVLLAMWRSPLTWSGGSARVHPHIFIAILLGGAILPAPVLLAVLRPGQQLTRHTIAIGHMLMSGLLIHLGGGQIEMHFEIFGTLAFLAFYRDWRVLIMAAIVTAVDHLMRGMIVPRSIYGIAYASPWLTLEHIGWVAFEDLFLIGSCVRGVKEMRGIAEQQALLESSHRDVEKKVEDRTAELKNAQDELMKAARTAGMAEIATSVLHNVGNVLNSVNVSATIVADTLKKSEVPSLKKVSAMMDQHKLDIGAYLTSDARGKLIPNFITDLATCLNDEQAAMANEIENLSKGIDHIKEIVAAQQSMAKKNHVVTAIKPAMLLENALKMQDLARNTVQVHKQYSDLPPMMIDQHKVLQVLINLINNACQAILARPAGQREIQLSVELISALDGDRLRYRVTDNGMGIAEENLARVFSHGFTTKKEGHGFGLHSAANAATEMKGSLTASSDGVNKGASFTLEVPAVLAQENVICSR